jgi:lathosterol oxidase
MVLLENLFFKWIAYIVINTAAFGVFYISAAYSVDTFLDLRTDIKSTSKYNEIKQSAKSWLISCPFISLFLWLVEEQSLCYSNLNEYGYIWFFCSIPLYLILHDTIFYWTHRMLHFEFMYKYFHCIHHKLKPPNAYTATSSSAIELLTEGIMSVFIPMFIIPVHYITGRILALGIMFWSCCTHADIDIIPKFLHKYLVTSKSHHVHHRVSHHNSCNYSMLFTFWDKICNTYVNPYKKES